VGHLTEDPEVRSAETGRVDETCARQVTVGHGVRAADPLETFTPGRCTAGGRGGITADEQDREVRFVTGTSPGRELAEATAQTVDQLADETRPTVGQLVNGTAPACPSLPPEHTCRLVSSFPSSAPDTRPGARCLSSNRSCHRACPARPPTGTGRAGDIRSCRGQAPRAGWARRAPSRTRRIGSCGTRHRARVLQSGR
jgi:hypothetical protein